VKTIHSRGEQPPDADLVVIRSGVLEKRSDEQLRDTAELNRQLHGFWGLSVLVASPGDLLQVCTTDWRVADYGKVSLSTVGRIRRAGSRCSTPATLPTSTSSYQTSKVERCSGFTAPSTPPSRTLPDGCQDEAPRGQSRPTRGTLMPVEPDVRVDYMRADIDGFVVIDASKLPAGARAHHCIVVGDDDAQPRVARIVEIAGERATLRILRGSVEENKDLLRRTAPAAR
jgi:hypothetical protein